MADNGKSFIGVSSFRFLFVECLVSNNWNSRLDNHIEGWIMEQVNLT